MVLWFMVEALLLELLPSEPLLDVKLDTPMLSAESASSENGSEFFFVFVFEEQCATVDCT